MLTQSAKVSLTTASRRRGGRRLCLLEALPWCRCKAVDVPQSRVDARCCASVNPCRAEDDRRDPCTKIETSQAQRKPSFQDPPSLQLDTLFMKAQ
jgi:hypothetical protein